MPRAKEPAAPWSISEVFLLTEGSQGRVAIPHLGLALSSEGIELTKEDGEPAWRAAWRTLDVLTVAERSTLPDGGEGVVLTVVELGGRQHRFVLPDPEPGQVGDEVRRWARAHRIQTFEPPAAVSRTLTVAVVVGAAATLAALLLSAAHLLHF
jgi:hypothetical protein